LYLLHVAYILCAGNLTFVVLSRPVSSEADGDGAKYWVSELIEWKTKRSSTSRERLVKGTSDGSDPALIAGILSSWVSMLDPVVSSKKEADVHWLLDSGVQ